MNDNLDDWLNSLEVESTDTPEAHSDISSQPVVQQPEAPSSEPQNLSDQDFDDILGDFGFSRPEDIEAEEIIEEESDHPNVTMADYENSYNEQAVQSVTTAMRDLDAEEDADWQEAIDSGGVIPVRRGIIEQMRQVEEAAQEPRTLTPSDIENALLEMTHNDGTTAREESPNEQQDLSINQGETLLPLNSPTLLLDESTTRFSGAEWYHEIQKQSIILAGCGGIGSWAALQLARLHPLKMVMYDDDTVEAVNMAGQLYARNDIGKSKVSAMSDMITAYTNMQNVYALQQRFDASTEAGNVMICGFDNMAARRTFFERWYWHVGNKPKEERKNCLFLDGRLSIDTLQVFCITGDDEYSCDKYNHEYLFSDAEADPTQCSLKQTTYLACMIGSVIVNLFTNFVANTLNPIIPYDLPFFTEYDAQNMIFKTVK